jgi:hypothetical protein
VKPKRGFIKAVISRAPILLVMKTIVLEKSLCCYHRGSESPYRECPTSNSRLHRLPFSISSKSTMLILPSRVMPIQGFLSKQWICLTMTEISRRRTDELRDFVAMLKFSTVDFDYCSRVSQQTLRQPFDETSLARSSRSQKHKVRNWPPRRRHATQVRLIHLDDLMNGVFLPDDSVSKAEFQSFRFVACLGRI